MSGWSDDIKALLRENPSVFSTRVIMRQFAYKKVASMSELKTAIKGYLAPKPKKSAKNQATKNTTSPEAASEKKARRIALTKYLAKQNILSSLIKDEIKKAFVELDLI